VVVVVMAGKGVEVIAVGVVGAGRANGRFGIGRGGMVAEGSESMLYGSGSFGGAFCPSGFGGTNRFI
jgi:hypothetical protein